MLIAYDCFIPGFICYYRSGRGRNPRTSVHQVPDDRLDDLKLGHNRQGQVVAGAAFVARLEVVAVAGEDRAVGQVAERAAEGIDRGVVNHSENCAHRERGSANIDKSKRRAAVNGHAESGNFPSDKITPVQYAFVGRERVEGQSAVDGEDARGSRSFAG